MGSPVVCSEAWAGRFFGVLCLSVLGMPWVVLGLILVIGPQEAREIHYSWDVRGFRYDREQLNSEDVDQLFAAATTALSWPGAERFLRLPVAIESIVREDDEFGRVYLTNANDPNSHAYFECQDSSIGWRITGLRQWWETSCEDCW